MNTRSASSIAVQPRARRGVRPLAAAILAVFAWIGCESDRGGVVQEPQDPVGSIELRVVDEDGQPVAEAIVTTNPPSVQALTDAAGTVVLSDLPLTTVTVVVTKAGFHSGSTTAAIVLGDTLQTAVTLRRLPPTPAVQPDTTGAVAGRVLFEDERPLPPGTRVQIFGAEVGAAPTCGAAAPVQVAATDGEGRFRAERLPRGAYRACVAATVAARDYVGEVAFAVREGDLARADIRVERAAAAVPGGTGTSEGRGTVALGDVFEFTFTLVSDGELPSTDVILTDTLPILDDPAGPPGPGDRDGNQAFRYVTDDPTFDPDAIRYYVDLDDDERGTITDVCFQAPSPLPAAFDRADLNAPCGTFQIFPTIAQARAAAQRASADGDQIVAIQYYNRDLLERTPPSGSIEAEDSFEITLQAIHSVNEFRLDNGAIPDASQENGKWCQIVTAFSAEGDFVTLRACTRVVEALLEVRKTVTDALVPAGGQTTFLIELGNTGSATLRGVAVADSLDAGFLIPLDGNPGLVRVSSLCPGCTATFNADSTIVTFDVPELPPTDLDRDGVFDDAEGFTVAALVVRTPLRQATLCNRVSASDGRGRRDSDLGCVVTRTEIELDVTNVDGLLTAAGEFQDVETFSVGDSVAYRTAVTNRSATATGALDVTWEIAPTSGILDFARVLTSQPPGISCSSVTHTCSVSVAALAPGASVILNYLTVARSQGQDVNRIRIRAADPALTVVNEEPTTVAQ